MACRVVGYIANRNLLRVHVGTVCDEGLRVCECRIACQPSRDWHLSVFRQEGEGRSNIATSNGMPIVEATASPKRFTIPRPRESRVIAVDSRCFIFSNGEPCRKLSARAAVLYSVACLVEPFRKIKWLTARHAIEHIARSIHPIELRERDVCIEKDYFLVLRWYALLKNIEQIFLVKQNRLRLDDMRLTKVLRRSCHRLHPGLYQLDTERWDLRRTQSFSHVQKVRDRCTPADRTIKRESNADVVTLWPVVVHAISLRWLDRPNNICDIPCEYLRQISELLAILCPRIAVAG